MNQDLNRGTPQTAKFSTPVALLGFNRPDLMRRQIETLRAVRPSRLLVVLDGPRANRPTEAALCAEVFDALRGVDWPCDLEVHRAEKNLGCRKRVSSGVTWVFSRVERAILLEDDCAPDLSFFAYAEEMLERYADDPRVMHISGFNPLPPDDRGETSYAFTQFPMIWGWAGWRRAWVHYDESLARWATFRAQWRLFRALPLLGYLYWNRKFFKIRRGFDTWDYQWTFACLTQGGLCARPNGNLMTNLGFRDDATHTTAAADVPTFRVDPLDFPLRHSEPVIDRKRNRAHLASMMPKALRPFL
jgi:hypothetical protein